MDVTPIRRSIPRWVLVTLAALIVLSAVYGSWCASRLRALVGRGAGEPALYELFYQQLVETEPLPESELTAFAKRRSDVTVRMLNDGGGAPAGRVEAGAPEAARGAERTGIQSRLELGAFGS